MVYGAVTPRGDVIAGHLVGVVDLTADHRPLWKKNDVNAIEVDLPWTLDVKNFAVKQSVRLTANLA